MSGQTWDDADNAAAYRRFERQHGRYRAANAALARQAQLAPGLRVLDLAAGTGGSTAALLPLLGPQGRVDCVEPARAMAQVGRQRLGGDARVRWLPSLAAAEGPYERIVCGAALWQFADLPSLLRRLARRLVPGGALVFNVPAAYLGRPDGPGGGADPWLTALLARACADHPAAPAPTPAPTLPDPDGLERWLVEAGLLPQRWQHRHRLRQAEWRDWCKLPVLSQALWPGVDAAQRAQRLDAAAAVLDLQSWRPEHWLGWTAWKPSFAIRALADATPLLQRPAALRRRAARDGALLLRGLLPRQHLDRLRRQLVLAARAERLVDGQGGWIGGHATAPHELPCWVRLQQRMHLLPEFQAMVQAQALLQTLAAVAGAPIEGGRGSVCRLAPPEHWVPATPAHRDAEFLRDSRGVWGAWVPLADCRVADGVLALQPGSHRGDTGGAWAAADMRQGDVLLLSAQTLHRGCPNLRLRQPRLSMDLRFGPAPGR